MHSRWLTTVNRIICLYVSSESSSKELVLLTDYVLKVYAPVWFNIKLEPQCYKEAKYLWLMVHLSCFLPNDIRAVVHKCIQRNAFFANPENILLTMLVDERQEIKELAARRIKVARKTQQAAIRKFKVPTLNLSAEEYCNVLNWQEFSRTEPPILKFQSDDELDNAILTAEKWLLDDFLDFLVIPKVWNGMLRLSQRLQRQSVANGGETAILEQQFCLGRRCQTLLPNRIGRVKETL